MNILGILIKLWPALKDALLGGLNIGGYIKRNKTVFILSIALTICFLCFMYMYEQAWMHGVVSKSLESKLVEIAKQQN